MADTVVHFEIMADDVERAKKFYSDLFGWTFESADVGIEYWLIKAGRSTVGDDTFGINGAILKRNAPKPADGNSPNAFICTIGVKDVDATMAKAVEMNATVQMPVSSIPGVGRFGYLKDPEGNLFGVLQPDMPEVA